MAGGESQARGASSCSARRAANTLRGPGDRVRGGRGRFVHAGPAQLRGDRRRHEAGHAAGIDEVEGGEVRGDVQGDPVVADAALDADPERPDLPRQRALGVGPAARVAVAPARGHAERRARLGHRRLERPHERPEQEAAVGEAEDRVRDELAGPVVGDLAAALDADDLDPAPAQLRGIGEDVALVGVAAERQDRRMLEQEQAITDRAVGAPPGELLLERPRLAVRDPPQPGRPDDPRPGGAVPRGRGHRVGLHAPTIAGNGLPPVHHAPAGQSPSCVAVCPLTTRHGIIMLSRRARSRVFACSRDGRDRGALPNCGRV